MSKENTFKRQNPTDIYKDRIVAIKQKLPTNWRGIFFARNPIYDNRHGYNLLNNVYMCRTADVHITEELEKISAEYIDEITKTA